MLSLGLGARLFAALLGLALIWGIVSAELSHAQPTCNADVAWRVVDSPDLGQSYHLNGVAARSSSDVWAVGTADTGSVSFHYDGTAWSQVPAPGTELLKVAVLGNDVWAVGSDHGAALLIHATP